MHGKPSKSLFAGSGSWVFFCNDSFVNNQNRDLYRFKSFDGNMLFVCRVEFLASFILLWCEPPKLSYEFLMSNFAEMITRATTRWAVTKVEASLWLLDWSKLMLCLTFHSQMDVVTNVPADLVIYFPMTKLVVNNGLLTWEEKLLSQRGTVQNQVWKSFQFWGDSAIVLTWLCC